jgi:hypothetical protein
VSEGQTETQGYVRKWMWVWVCAVGIMAVVAQTMSAEAGGGVTETIYSFAFAIQTMLCAACLERARWERTYGRKSIVNWVFLAFVLGVGSIGYLLSLYP